MTRLGDLRDRLEREIMGRCGGVTVNGDSQSRVRNTTNLLFDGVDGQALVARLDQRGVRCSQSSACTNQRPEPSHVLRAMGLSEEEAYGSVRFSLSVLNDEEEVEAASAAVEEEVKPGPGVLRLEGGGPDGDGGGGRMRFGGHETFPVRDGWLHKGLKLVAEEPDKLRDEHVADWLGVGRNVGLNGHAA